MFVATPVSPSSPDGVGVGVACCCVDPNIGTGGTGVRTGDGGTIAAGCCPKTPPPCRGTFLPNRGGGVGDVVVGCCNTPFFYQDKKKRLNDIQLFL